MSRHKSMLREIKKLKQSIQPKPDEMLTMYFPSLDEMYEMTVREFDAAEKSAWNGTPNKLAAKFMKYLEEGHIDDGGLVCFFYSIPDLWADDWAEINREG